MMPIYLIVRIKLLSKVLNIVTNFTFLSKTKFMSIYYYIRRDHESSGFRKLAVKYMDLSRETLVLFPSAKIKVK